MRYLLDFFSELLPDFDRQRIMCEAEAFAAHMDDQATPTDVNEFYDDQIAKKSTVTSLYDQRHLLTRPARKWYSPSQRTTVKRGICVHHTAVEGGFGVNRQTVAYYEEPDKVMTKLRTGRHLDWSEKIQKLVDYPDPADTFTVPELARMHALGARYRGSKVRGTHGKGQPYHAITGRNSTLYLNLPFDWVTWHGNGANTNFLGYAWDGNSLKETPPASEIIEDLCTLAELMRSESHRCDELTVHSSWTNKPHDPGPEFIETVLIPAAERIGATIDLDFTHGNGRPISGILGHS